MIEIAILLVLGSGLLHSVWNLFTKKSLNKNVFLWTIHLFSSALLLPYLWTEFDRHPLEPEGYTLLGISFMFQIGYIFLLSKAYQYGEMSQVYPMMRGLGALLVPVCSVLLFQESLSAIGWFGLGLIVLGLFTIAFYRMDPKNMPVKAITAAVGVGVCITGYTLTDKTIMEQGHMTPLALLEISNLSYVIALLIPALTSRQIKQEWVRNWKLILAGTFCSPGSYFLFLLSMNIAPLSHISPIREIGTVFGTLFGIWLLKEQQGFMRVTMSACIALGIISIGIWG
ncbi:EamA family transporter [Paenibacillus sp. LMG 31456]|uniref:EamA family transporter n=1 Tax=Paenibacillus foliorum TaxID=2654974 RepID=A0A972GRF3_9BACL|nr:DMT family transporter [Paenibacillus foliorum]NOU94805.1 EamA family transporter [Paenibacillus foliorum]